MRMRLREFVLVWVLLSVSCFWSQSRYGVKGDEVSDFLDAKEQQVRQIADMATENSDNTCDLVSSCALSNQCTRSGCSPLKSDNLLCTYVAENQNCNFTSGGGFCDSTNVNFNRSYVRTPTNYSSGSVPFEVVNSVCAQRKLDDLFLNLQRLQNSSAYYFNFYFGSVDGSFRFFPGVQVKSCYTFDPRLRPWYSGSISVKKNLVILLDASSSMGTTIDFLSQTTRFTAAKNVTQLLLQTLTASDTATIMTFDSAADTTPLNETYAVPVGGLNVLDPLFIQLNTSIADASVSGDSNAVSNLTAGLSQAISSFNGASSDALKIVVLFTSGGFSSNLSGPIITEFTQQSIRLITYEFVSTGTGSTPSPVLRDLSCRVDGLTEQLNPRNLVQNPLFAVKSYFSFLARSQKEITPDAYWQAAYRDFGSLGSVITVALPAFSSDGELIGVAGIDVQVGGLDQSFQTKLSNQIRDRRTGISINTNGSTFDDCKPAYNDSLGQCNAKTGLTPFCARDDFVSSYTDLACCPDCRLLAGLGPPRSGFNKSLIIIVICSVLAVLTLLGLSVCFWYKCYRPYMQEVDPFLKIPRFSYRSLSVATNKFSHLLGKGTFGSVYKGTLKDGTLVAVKKLLHQPNFSDFQAEIRVLATANHINLVALKGFCTEQHELLVYEFVRNGDLDQWLFEWPELDENIILEWNHRVLIARGVAKGLAYLHENLQHSQRVYHSDIKPANILLDEDFNPKLGDFGMAKLYKNGSELFASGGTLGYIAPEIHAGEPATTKADVYSYGMVLLEMVSGKKFNDPSLEGMLLPLWAGTKVNEVFDSDVIDPRLGTLSEAEELMAQRLIHIALLCTQKASEQRPEMSAVEQMIKGASVSSIRSNYDSQDSHTFSNTFLTETSSFSLSRSRSDGNPESRPFPHPHPRSLADIFHRMRAGVSTPFY